MDSSHYRSGVREASQGGSNERTQPSYRSSSSRADGGRGEGAAPFARVLPHSREAEEALLGGIIIDNEAMNSALERVKHEDFYDSRYQQIFRAMAELSDRREPIDFVTLQQKLRSMGVFESIGGLPELSRLAESTPTSANVTYYARLVKDASTRRSLIREASDIINEAFNDELSLENFLDIAEQRILGVSNVRSGKGFIKIGEIVQDSISVVEKLYERKQPITGVGTGLTELDLLTAGFQPSDLIIIAARPSMGKTALALSIAGQVAVHQKRPVGVFSLEMSKEQLVLRLLCAEAAVDNSRARNGRLQENDFPQLVQAASILSEAPLFIDDTPAVTVTELRAKCRRLHREHPLSLVVVDYLQLMRSPAYMKSREQEIADISRSLKALAKELNVPVVALSQLNRSVESRTDRRPGMADLRESGAIEQDADLIMFIYRDEVYNKETTTQRGIAELIIAKQRNGPIGTVKVHFKPEFTQFVDLPGDEMFNLDDLFEEPTPSAPHSGGGLPTSGRRPIEDPSHDPFGEVLGDFEFE